LKRNGRKRSGESPFDDPSSLLTIFSLEIYLLLLSKEFESLVNNAPEGLRPFRFNLLWIRLCLVPPWCTRLLSAVNLHQTIGEHFLSESTNFSVLVLLRFVGTCSSGA